MSNTEHCGVNLPTLTYLNKQIHIMFLTGFISCTPPSPTHIAITMKARLMSVNIPQLACRVGEGIRWDVAHLHGPNLLAYQGSSYFTLYINRYTLFYDVFFSTTMLSSGYNFYVIMNDPFCDQWDMCMFISVHR